MVAGLPDCLGAGAPAHLPTLCTAFLLLCVRACLFLLGCADVCVMPVPSLPAGL